MLAIGRLLTVPSIIEKPQAFTILPLTKDLIYAYFPTQLVSAQESKPNRVPWFSSIYINIGCRKFSIIIFVLVLPITEVMVLIIK